MDIRVGTGIDVHAFSEDRSRPLFLACLQWPGERGLEGHSDADVAAHAACDAILIASGVGDLGTAFGTGAHETTQLCIRALSRYMKLMQAAGVQDIRVLDVGTGSGILGIAARKLGASHVFATDLDENAMEAVQENLASNDLDPAGFTVVCGNLIDDPTVQAAAGEARYDIALANILAPVILLLEKEIWRHLKPGGIFITSGVIDEKEEEVRAAIASNPHFEVLEVNRQGEWSSIVARKRG